MLSQSTLLFTTQMAGFFLLVSTMVLIAMRRIYFDAETKQPIEFELPFFGKIRSQAPAFAVVLVGAAMVLFPLSRMTPDQATISGRVETDGKSVTMMVVAIPYYQQSVDASGPIELPIPLLQGIAGYRVKFLVGKQVIDDQQAVVHGGKVQLNPVKWSEPQDASPLVQLPTRKEVSDEELKSFQISN
jgi:hypothetical protein